MNTIVEITGITGIAYEIQNGNSKVATISIESFKREIKGYTYFILIDNSGNCIRDAYDFLNTFKTYAIGDKVLKIREQALTALKLLYSYMELYQITRLEHIDEDEIKRFKSFLRGGEFRGTECDFIGITKRGNTTINIYQYYYRRYFKFLGLKENIFLDEVLISSERSSGPGFLSHAKKNITKKFAQSERIYASRETPKYLSYKEYLCIKELIDNDFSLREDIIVTLMYKYGLRIGEVLGLTLEDVEESVGETYAGKLILRNRVTDKGWQHAKSCLNVLSREDYLSKAYKTRDVGYQVIELDSEDFNMVSDYMTASRSPLAYKRKDRKKSIVLDNLEKKNVADKVTNRNDINKNSYLFISKNGTPLTGEGWNKICRKIFEGVGIPVDKGVREDNLNHRFRHGYAMYKVIIDKYGIIELQNAMRHSNPNSCRTYFNVDEKEKGRLAHETQELLIRGGIHFDE
jgi:integrase